MVNRELRRRKRGEKPVEKPVEKLVDVSLLQVSFTMCQFLVLTRYLIILEKNSVKLGCLACIFLLE